MVSFEGGIKVTTNGQADTGKVSITLTALNDGVWEQVA